MKIAGDQHLLTSACRGFLWLSFCCFIFLSFVSSASVVRTSNSCCSSTSTTTSVEEFNLKLKDAVGEVRKVLLSRTQKFDEFFRDLLKTSKKDFHTMFLQTYGLLYERNSFIFTDMFQELEKYYTAGGVDLNEVLDSFFHRLYSKMFQVLNAQYTFDETYLKCVSENMEELKPFGDIPKKLKIEVKRSFVATRTFVQAMTSGADVLGRVMDISVSRDCVRHLESISTCTQCGTGQQIAPCESTCIMSASRCLSLHSEMNPEWDNFVNSLLLLSSRLETSFNIESVVDPIDIKISEAIMNFQENGIAVSQKLFDECGKPRIGKRSPSPQTPFSSSSSSHTHHSSSSHHSLPSSLSSSSSSSSAGSTSGNLRLPVDNYRYSRPTSGLSHGTSGGAAGSHVASGSAGASIDRLLQDIKRKVKKTKDYWTTLSTSLCRSSSSSQPQSQSSSSSLSTSSSSSSSSLSSGSSSNGGIMTTSCFNGTQVIIESASAASAHILSGSSSVGGLSSGGNQRRGVSSPSHQNLNHNFSPESSANMRQQILRLKLISTKLNYAYNGLDVEWDDSTLNHEDSASPPLSSSSSSSSSSSEGDALQGSGSGGGRFDSDDEDDDRDPDEDERDRNRCVDEDDDDCDDQDRQTGGNNHRNPHHPHLDPNYISSSSETNLYHKKDEDDALYHSSTPSHTDGNSLHPDDEDDRDPDARRGGNNQKSRVITLYSGSSFQRTKLPSHHIIIHYCLIFILMPIVTLINARRWLISP